MSLIYQVKNHLPELSHKSPERVLPVLQEYSNPHNFKICVLMKAFKGEEFLAASILSVYNYVSKIVIVNSAVSWTGGKGNTCVKVIEELKNSDPFNKIISLRYDTTDQTQQVDFGYNFIKKNLPQTSHVMLLDSDEVHDDPDLIRALDYLHANPNYPVYRCQMKTYIKSPLYRITPTEMCQPVLFVNARLHDLGGGWRGNNLSGPLMPNVFFHHFIHVRKDFNSVFEKIITSHASEGFPYVDMSRWISEVWCKLPNLEGEWKHGFHPNTSYPASWKGVEVIEPDQLPNVLKNNSFEILEQYGIMNEKRKEWRPEPTKQFVVDCSRTCSINPPCLFCYHRHTYKDWAKYDWSFEKTKQCIDDGIARGNTHLQYTGGEPTIYPHINQLIEYALSRGVKSSIITNGLVSKEKAQSLIDSGLDSFLVSRHGLRATHDYITNRKGNYDRQIEFLNFISDKIELRFNCVISKFNQSELVQIAEEMSMYRPKRISWINMNPHNHWSQDAEGTGQVIADLDVVSPLLNQAITYLESAGIVASVRYFPFCRLNPQHWGNIYNDKMCVFDSQEWDYSIMPKTFEAFEKWGRETSECIEEKGEPCCDCDIHHICGGANKAFHAVSNAIYGERLRPIQEPRFRDLPFYYFHMVKKGK